MGRQKSCPCFVWCVQKGQLLKIFEVFGSPPDDYWQNMELSPSLKPPETYKSTTAERFRDLPPSTIGLLATLLALDPAARGTAAQALQSSVRRHLITSWPAPVLVAPC
jgi:cyclin-dependent kinase 12/13